MTLRESSEVELQFIHHPPHVKAPTAEALGPALLNIATFLFSFYKHPRHLCCEPGFALVSGDTSLNKSRSSHLLSLLLSGSKQLLRGVKGNPELSSEAVNTDFIQEGKKKKENYCKRGRATSVYRTGLSAAYNEESGNLQPGSGGPGGASEQNINY